MGTLLPTRKYPRAFNDVQNITFADRPTIIVRKKSVPTTTGNRLVRDRSKKEVAENDNLF